MSRVRSSQSPSPPPPGRRVSVEQIPNNVLLEFTNADDLKPYPNNPHKHPKEQLEQVRASIRAYGVVGAVAADEDGVIINGELVWQAAKLEGKSSIPVLRLLGLSESQKRELRIGLNKHQHNADWDTEQLRLEIQAILEKPLDSGQCSTEK